MHSEHLVSFHVRKARIVRVTQLGDAVIVRREIATIAPIEFDYQFYYLRVKSKGGGDAAFAFTFDSKLFKQGKGSDKQRVYIGSATHSYNYTIQINVRSYGYDMPYVAVVHGRKMIRLRSLTKREERALACFLMRRELTLT